MTEELFHYVLNSVKQNKPDLHLDNVNFELIEEGLCVQVMHNGSYDNEPETFALMEQFCSQNKLEKLEKVHREIYISDARKTAQEKLKTVLRFKVTEI